MADDVTENPTPVTTDADARVKKRVEELANRLVMDVYEHRQELSGPDAKHISGHLHVIRKGNAEEPVNEFVPGGVLNFGKPMYLDHVQVDHDIYINPRINAEDGSVRITGIEGLYDVFDMKKSPDGLNKSGNVFDKMVSKINEMKPKVIPLTELYVRTNEDNERLVTLKFRPPGSPFTIDRDYNLGRPSGDTVEGKLFWEIRDPNNAPSYYPKKERH